MASAVEIVSSLKRLTHAYAGKEQARETMELYIEMLADIPGYVLKRAVEEYIAEATWFPRISELRQAAEKVAGTNCFWELPETLVDRLRGEAVQLENLFFRDGILDADMWEQLAGQFEQAGREYGAEGVRKKLQAYQAIAEQE